MSSPDTSSLETKRTNFRTNVIALSMTRLADGLLNPKLVLAWLVTTLGGGAIWVGLLVPVREAGALLPQLFTAPRIKSTVIRKWWWVSGSIVQGVAALLIGISAFMFEGALAGAVIVGLVAILALARSIASVSYKDVLGKTVVKEKRGQVSGNASSISAIGIFIFGVLLMANVGDRLLLVVGSLGLAAVLWLLAAYRFATLVEPPSMIQAPDNRSVATQYWHFLRDDGELRWFIFVRALLVSTAIAPPFMLLLGNGAGGVLSQLGALIVATSLASFVSGWVWGKLSDRSTRKVLVLSGIGGGVSLLAAAGATTHGFIANPLVLPGLMFVLMTMYQGVRVARNTHLVNLADEDTRAAYTALSNTIIGIVLLATGLLGVVAAYIGVTQMVYLLGGSALLGGVFAWWLKEV